MTARKEWFTAAELAALKLPGLPVTESGMIRAIKRGSWPSRLREAAGGGREYHLDSLPGPARAWLDRQAAAKSPSTTTPDSAVLWAHFDRLPQEHKDTADQRLRAVLEFQAMSAAGVRAGEAERRIAADRGVDAATLRRWRAAVKSHPRADWLAVLAPRYSVQGAPPVPIPVEAWEIFKADYLRLEEPAATACYERLTRIAKTKDWGKLPSCKTFLRRVEKEIPAPVIVLKRKGEEAMNRLFPHQERDRSVFRAMEAVNADGHRFDFFAHEDEDPAKTPFRPHLLATQDLYSGLLLGWRLSDRENAETVRLAFGDAFAVFGPADEVYLDNGRGFASKWVTGGTEGRFRFKRKADEPTGCLVAAGCRIHWATPYHGQAKPIERAFRDLAEYIAKHPAFAGAYTGKNPQAKPENYASRSVPMSVVRRVVAEEIAAHNARPGRRSSPCAGRSFRETFDASYAAAMPRRLTAEQRRLFWLAAEAVTADRMDGAVSLFGARWWHETLTAHRGRKLIVRFDPENFAAGAAVYEPCGRFLCDAELRHRAAFNDTTAAKEHARAKRRFRAGTKMQADALVRMDALAVAAALPGAAAPAAPTKEPKVVRPKFGADTRKGALPEDEADARFSASVTRLSERHEAMMRKRMLA